MASRLITSLIAVGLLVSPATGQSLSVDDYAPEAAYHEVRGGCNTAARQAVEMTGGELLSVRPARNGRPVCAVTVLVINAKGRPKKVRLRIPMDF
ncbi:hypothetical protein JJB09_03510 [Rhizobium sp. KVB221]|uniref:Uncharacterized protein n=1 Tax=Rhizobium setariae TaxID=2801340 RepID=A0A936YQR1_9HYPH|nr:hypothetical protein [Rhizobium setariae]MBL0371086.1 hypothetical protein [Rhizobium setariae]